MLHKGTQKRIYFEGATYFVTGVADERSEYFKEPIFCELFVEVLRLAKTMKRLDLYAFIVLVDHFHLMFLPHKPEDLSKIMQFIKRHFTRNINFILGCTDKGEICKSLLRIRGEYKIYVEMIKNHYDHLKVLKDRFIQKYGTNQSVFPKFKWQKSFHDHYPAPERPSLLSGDGGAKPNSFGFRCGVTPHRN
jgi:REP element-mobilizing transposase RayT